MPSKSCPSRPVRISSPRQGRRVAGPVTVDPAKLDYAAHRRAAGHTVAEIATKTGIPRTSLYPAPAAPALRVGHRRELPVQPSADPPDGVPHSAPAASSPNQAYGTLISADAD